MDPSDVCTGDQQVYVVSALVGDHTFEVHHMPHNAVLTCYAHTAQDLTGFPGNLYSHIHIIPLSH